MIYLDNNATTQPTARVVAAMLPYLTDCYFNASSSTAAFTGADKPRRDAAAAMAKLLNAEEPECITFTSGATESNNWVFFPFATGRKAGRIVISAIEHPSIAEPADALARTGVEVVVVPVDAQGVVQMGSLRDALSEETALVSIMAANNETGVLEPIAEIGRMVRERCPAALFHTDATQAVGKIAVDLQADWADVDLLSFSAHKFHGPKGIGGLYIRPGIELEPMILGGGQENGLRSGTSNTPALAGLAAAASEACHLEIDVIRGLRDTFETRVQNALPNAIIHSLDSFRLPNTSYISLPGVDGEQMATGLAASGIVVGTGAACSSGALQGSKTLRSMGIAGPINMGGLRISLSRFSTIAEIDALLEIIAS
jgi:cysteine desulfurase